MTERVDVESIERQLHALAAQLRPADPAASHLLTAIAMTLAGEPGFDNAALHLAHFLNDAPMGLLDRAYLALSVLERGGTDMDAVHAMRGSDAGGDGA